MVTAFGLADPIGLVITPEGIEGARPVFRSQFGSGFTLYIEGRPGPSGLDVGTKTLNTSATDPGVQPDLQIVASQNLGDGSPAVCDRSAPLLGGIPKVDPPVFSPVQAVSDALNDLSCRFTVFDESDFPCTQDDSGALAFTDPNSTLQYCLLISTPIAFPPGDTVLTARLRDAGGNVGLTTSIIVRVTQPSGP